MNGRSHKKFLVTRSRGHGGSHGDSHGFRDAPAVGTEVVPHGGRGHGQGSPQIGPKIRKNELFLTFFR